MKNSFLIRLCLFLFSFSFFMLVDNPVYSQATSSEKIEYLYPANKEKTFDETADEFYQALRDIKYSALQELYRRNKHRQKHLDTVLFKEMPDASASIRKKVLFKETETFNYITWDGNIHTTYPDIDTNYHQAVSPDRQVYFFLSFKDTEEEFKGRYAIYDVETKEMVAGGGVFAPKYPTYRDPYLR